MSNKSFYFHSVSIENYRGIKDLSIDALRRINIIGGFNGAGKTTLMEGLFFILDRRAPDAMVRPSGWRGIGFSGYSALKDYFYNKDLSKPVHLYVTTPQGKIDLILRSGQAKYSTGEPVGAFGAGGSKSSYTSATQDGVIVSTEIDGQEVEVSFIQATVNGIEFRNMKPSITPVPTASYISSLTRNNSIEQATRFSEVSRQGRVKELIEVLSIIRPNIKDIRMLFDSSMPVIYIEFENGQIYPAAMLGDGFLTLLMLTLIMLLTKGGVVFLDEFDATIHYSVLADVWGMIGLLASKYDCQVFAVTHSLECVKAAVKGLEAKNRLDDLQYIRMERTESGSDAVCYDPKELKFAASESWEIR